ncbi:hypothetical protein [Rhodopila sp.]|uniref:hypothetical protein n=1 Tax=Rhodopila sp. TaxID=2480087 RepID=UPI003D142EEF
MALDLVKNIAAQLSAGDVERPQTAADQVLKDHISSAPSETDQAILEEAETLMASINSRLDAQEAFTDQLMKRYGL